MKMKSNCAVFSRQLLHHGNQPNDPAVLVEQFFIDNKKDISPTSSQMKASEILSMSL